MKLSKPKEKRYIVPTLEGRIYRCECGNCIVGYNSQRKCEICNAYIDWESAERSKAMVVKIKLLPGGKMPEKKTKGAAAFDCYAREDKMLIAPTVIPLGFAMELPEGYHAEIVPRSSIGLNTVLRMANSVGIIDSDYRGEVGFIGESQNGNIIQVKAGDRIAQMIIKKNINVKLEQAEELSDTERGAGGFGSTGK